MKVISDTHLKENQTLKRAVVCRIKFTITKKNCLCELPCQVQKRTLSVRLKYIKQRKLGDKNKRLSTCGVKSGVHKYGAKCVIARELVVVP